MAASAVVLAGQGVAQFMQDLASSQRHREPNPILRPEECLEIRQPSLKGVELNQHQCGSRHDQQEPRRECPGGKQPARPWDTASGETAPDRGRETAWPAHCRTAGAAVVAAFHADVPAVVRLGLPHPPRATPRGTAASRNSATAPSRACAAQTPARTPSGSVRPKSARPVAGARSTLPGADGNSATPSGSLSPM